MSLSCLKFTLFYPWGKPLGQKVKILSTLATLQKVREKSHPYFFSRNSLWSFFKSIILSIIGAMTDINFGEVPFNKKLSLVTQNVNFCFILLTQLDIVRRWCQGLFRPQVPCTLSLHCPIANSASR